MSDDLKTLVAQEVAKQLAAIAADQTTKKVLEFLKNRNSADAYVVETWQSGTEWYRVWSDGLIEQGGLADITSASDGKEVTFLKAFSTVILNMTATVKDNTEGYYLAFGCFTDGSISLTGVTVRALNSVDTAIKAKVFWYAIGY